MLLHNASQQLDLLADRLYMKDIDREDVKRVLKKLAEKGLDLEVICFIKTYRRENGDR